MTSSHLLIGSGGEIGRELTRKLAGAGERVHVTSHRTDDSSVSNRDVSSSAPLFWDFRTPRTGLSDMDQALGPDPLRSLSIFAHPPFLREGLPISELSDTLSSFDGFLLLLNHLDRRLIPGSSLLFFFPSLSHHKADSYLSARTWLGAFQGIFEEWSRKHRTYHVMGIEILITPDTRTPHLSKEMIQRIAGRTSRGRLANAGEIADFAAYVIRSGNPLFHGQILRTEGGPYY